MNHSRAVLSVTAGQGHNQTAKAIMNQMTQVGYEVQSFGYPGYIALVLGSRWTRATG